MDRLISLLCTMLLMAGCTANPDTIPVATPPNQPSASVATESQPAPGAIGETDPLLDTTLAVNTALADLPPYAEEATWRVNGNKPLFTEQGKDLAIKGEPFEFYSGLDSLSRCGVTYANVCPATMPTEEREGIGMIRPSGWQTANYHDLVEGNYLYNRCHLIGYQLTGENANPQNLITGTRYMNTIGMLPYENETATYVERTGNHVLYRVTPIFTGNNLVADGVLMEAWSVEDRGESVEFCVFCYNVQPGIIIDRATGNSKADPNYVHPTETPIDEATYILNTRSKKFHRPDCSGAGSISEHNCKETDRTRDDLAAAGYTPCGICHP